MPDLVVDQLYLITVAVFAVASFGIILRSRRRRPPSSDRVGLAGLRTAVLASIVPVAILALVLLIVALTLGGLIGTFAGSGYTAPTPPTVDPVSRARDNLIGLLWLVSIPGVTFLAVLDLYAIWPPGSEDAGAAKRYAVRGTLFSLFLLGVGLLAPVLFDEAAASSAKRDAEVAFDQLQRDIEARSAALSVEVTVVDAGLGAGTKNGRVVEHLTLDVRVRSTTDIELRQGADGIGQQVMWLQADGLRADGIIGTLARVDIDWEELPVHMPAGFDTTYRIEVPIKRSEQFDATNPAATGSWRLIMYLQDRSPGPERLTSMGLRELDYETRTDFTVADTP
jgi:hypothetical protein